MSKNFANPAHVLVLLERLVAELRAAGVTHVAVDDLEAALTERSEARARNNQPR